MNRQLKAIMEYNQKADYTKEALRGLVENSGGLELLVKAREKRRDFITRFDGEANGVPFEHIGSFVAGGLKVQQRAASSRSYGENDVLLYLFDIYVERNKEGKAEEIYFGTFVIRHGRDSGTYFALKTYEAKHELKSAGNSAKFLKRSD